MVQGGTSWRDRQGYGQASAHNSAGVGPRRCQRPPRSVDGDGRCSPRSSCSRDFADDELGRLAGAPERPALRRGDVLFAEGDDADELFVVVSGRIAIANRSIDGRESVVALMEAGRPVRRDGRCSTARAARPRPGRSSRREVVAIPYEPAARASTRPARAAVERRARCSPRGCATMDGALADAVFLDVTGRTAKRLLELAGEADEFLLPVTQEELAGMVGASRERVNKAHRRVRPPRLDRAERPPLPHHQPPAARRSGRAR